MAFEPVCCHIDDARMKARCTDLFCEVASLSDGIASRRDFLNAFRGLWADLGLTAHEFTNGDHPYLRCTGDWIQRVVPKKQQGGAEVKTGEGISVYFRWMPPEEPYLQFDPTKRCRFNCIIPAAVGWERAEQMLRSMVVRLDGFWGELNDGRICRPTFSSFDSHSRTIPHVGMMNYWGPEYIEVFGGRARIDRAGFHSVEDYHRGVIVYVGPVQNSVEFECRQREIESRLEEADFWSRPPD